MIPSDTSREIMRAVCSSHSSLRAIKSPKEDIRSAPRARAYAVAMGDRVPRSSTMHTCSKFRKREGGFGESWKSGRWNLCNLDTEGQVVASASCCASLSDGGQASMLVDEGYRRNLNLRQKGHGLSCKPSVLPPRAKKEPTKMCFLGGRVICRAHAPRFWGKLIDPENFCLHVGSGGLKCVGCSPPTHPPTHAIVTTKLDDDSAWCSFIAQPMAHTPQHGTHSTSAQSKAKGPTYREGCTLGNACQRAKGRMQSLHFNARNENSL